MNDYELSSRRLFVSISAYSLQWLTQASKDHLTTNCVQKHSVCKKQQNGSSSFRLQTTVVLRVTFHSINLDTFLQHKDRLFYLQKHSVEAHGRSISFMIFIWMLLQPWLLLTGENTDHAALVVCSGSRTLSSASDSLVRVVFHLEPSQTCGCHQLLDPYTQDGADPEAACQLGEWTPN